MKQRPKVIIRQQMFHYIQPIVIISRLVGLSPVRYQKIGENYTLTISYLYVAYSYIFGLVLAGSALLGLVEDLKATPEHSLRIKDNKGAYVVSCDLGLMISIVILGIFISPFKINKLFLILASLNQVHAKLPTSIKEGQRRTSLIVSLVSYTIFFGVLTYDFLGWCIQTNGKPSSKRLWNNIPVYILYLVSWTQEIYFWHVTYFVKQCVQALSLGLTFHVENGGKKVRNGLKVFSINNLGATFPSDNSLKNNLTSQNVKTFVNVYRILFGTVNLINDWYGIPLMLILLSCFLQLIGTPYFILSNTNEKSIVFSILQIVWLFTHTSRLLIIVESSHRCVEEFEKINYLLCQHLEREYDLEVMHELKILALQISTCKMKFSTCGVATLDRSILASIAGAVTTFLVILVEFDENSIPPLAEGTTSRTAL